MLLHSQIKWHCWNIFQHIQTKKHSKLSQLINYSFVCIFVLVLGNSTSNINLWKRNFSNVIDRSSFRYSKVYFSWGPFCMQKIPMYGPFDVTPTYNLQIIYNSSWQNSSVISWIWISLYEVHELFFIKVINFCNHNS